MKTFTSKLNGPLPDFYDFCARRKAEAKKRMDEKLSTPEQQLDALLKASRTFVEKLKHYPHSGHSIDGYSDFLEVLQDVELRR